MGLLILSVTDTVSSDLNGSKMILKYSIKYVAFLNNKYTQFMKESILLFCQIYCQVIIIELLFQQ